MCMKKNNNRLLRGVAAVLCLAMMFLTMSGMAMATDMEDAPAGDVPESTPERRWASSSTAARRSCITATSASSFFMLFCCSRMKLRCLSSFWRFGERRIWFSNLSASMSTCMKFQRSSNCTSIPPYYKNGLCALSKVSTSYCTAFIAFCKPSRRTRTAGHSVAAWPASRAAMPAAAQSSAAW